MTLVNAETTVPKSEKNARYLIAAFIGLFALTAAFLHTPISLFTLIALMALTVALVGFVPFLLLKQKGWQKWRIWAYATVLLICGASWIPAIKPIAVEARTITEERARNFVAQVNEYFARTGILPTNNAELAVANIAVPNTMLGGPMRYQTSKVDVKSWSNFSRYKTGKDLVVDGVKPIFVVRYTFALSEYCEIMSQIETPLCESS